MIGEDYFSWRENVEQHFQVLTAAPQLKGLLQDYIQSLGFDFFAFFIQHRVPFTRPRVYLHDTYPEAWIKRYKERNYYAIDPVLQRCLRAGKGVEWTPELFCSAKEMWQEALRDPHKSALINQHHISVGSGEVIKNGAQHRSL